ncbi:RelA/SpoT family protein [Cardiobacterium valvarum]|uniref:guanosine-3',5'-bis(diphosphate) 3'-diphosphatase n=1 Tax=Cardiobacterium valvarum TaxID=194702 RepID=A0A381EDD4_9GAMM|nr:RelA/SpoT family protein [Cardiobacterium valvarum]SUX25044.1 Bifunctional (p)ppGpp synthase/hydrolase SpoT [Cardiobacterium valvarum]
MNAPLALEYQPFGVFTDAATLQAAYDDLAVELKKYLDPEDIDKVLRCAIYGAAAHEGQRRQSGEPYFVHPIAVCRILARQRFDLPVLQAGLLHDVLEDTILNKKDMATEFGEDVTRLVDGVSKLDRLKKTAPQAAVADSFRKMFLATADDPRVLIIKLADRLHNMQTLGALRRDKQQRIAHETLDVYAAIAGRLGLFYFRIQLEDLAFSYLYPWRHAVLRKHYNEDNTHEQTLRTVRSELQARLQILGIKASINPRQRHLWGVYQRMKRKESFKEAIRTVPIRIITDSEDNCYRILGALHSLYRPVHGKFEDYIAAPKSNGYRSLHSSVIMGDGTALNVQIRTRDMHTLAEAGIISVWHQYAKQRAVKIEAHSIEAEKTMREWLSRLKEVQNITDDPLQFYDAIKKELVTGEMQIYTPKGDIIALPHGATPVDLAYTIHTEIGNHIVGAKVNGQPYPIYKPLKMAQTVEILTDPDAHPHNSWLQFTIPGGKAHIGINRYLNRLARQNAGLATSSKQVTDSEQKILVHSAFESGITLAPCCHPLPLEAITGHSVAGSGILIHGSDCPLLETAAHTIAADWADERKGLFPSELAIKAYAHPRLLARVSGAIADSEANITDFQINHADSDEQRRCLTVWLEVRDLEHLTQVMHRLRQLEETIGIRRITHKEPTS